VQAPLGHFTSEIRREVYLHTVPEVWITPKRPTGSDSPPSRATLTPKPTSLTFTKPAKVSRSIMLWLTSGTPAPSLLATAAVLLAAPASLICSRASNSTRQLPSLPRNLLDHHSSPVSRKWALSPSSRTINPYRRRFFPKDNRRCGFTNGRVGRETVVRGSIKHSLRYRRGVRADTAITSRRKYDARIRQAKQKATRPGMNAWPVSLPN